MIKISWNFDDVCLNSPIYLLPLVVTLTVVSLTSIFLPALEALLPEISLATLLLNFWAIHHFHAPLLVRFSLKPHIAGKLS